MNYLDGGKIIAFSKGSNPEEPLLGRIQNTFTPPTSNIVVYYEWDKSNKKWNKTNDTDPEPIQSSLPSGLFDGQIIEVEIPE